MVRNIKSLYSDKFVFNVPLFSIAASSPDGSVDGPPSPTSSSPTTTTTNAGGQGSPGQGGVVLGGVGFSDGTLPTPTNKPRDPFKRRPILRPPRPSFATGGGDNGNTDAPIGGPVRRPSFPPRPPPKNRPFRYRPVISQLKCVNDGIPFNNNSTAYAFSGALKVFCTKHERSNVFKRLKCS